MRDVSMSDPVCRWKLEELRTVRETFEVRTQQTVYVIFIVPSRMHTLS